MTEMKRVTISLPDEIDKKNNRAEKARYICSLLIFGNY